MTDATVDDNPDDKKMPLMEHLIELRKRLVWSLAAFALISCGIAYTNIAQQPGSPGDTSLWRTMGLGLLVVSLLVTLGGIFSSLFEQAERRAEDERRRKRSH